MSIVTANEANDIILGAVNDCLKDTMPILYENKAGDIPQGEAWCRPTVRHSGSRQATLCDESSLTRYDVWGVLIVQLFFPLGKGLETAYTVSEQLTQLLRKYKSEVWFRNTVWEEVGPDDGYYLFKINSQFEYTQLR